MMGWFGFSAPPEDEAPVCMEIPLFPLNTVLFPGGVLPLRIFEQRYLDMAAACMKEAGTFGICLIAAGEEAGGVAEPHPVGTLARITDWEMEQLGILQVSVRGEQRFRILEKTVGANNLLRATVEVINDDGPVPESAGDFDAYVMTERAERADPCAAIDPLRPGSPHPIRRN